MRLGVRVGPFFAVQDPPKDQRVNPIAWAAGVLFGISALVVIVALFWWVFLIAALLSLAVWCVVRAARIHGDRQRAESQETAWRTYQSNIVDRL